jgi:nucleoside-diphosphate-sugar epimerase
MHTILGSGGVVGNELSKALGAEGRPVRQVSRTPRRVNPTDETAAADLLDEEAVQRAVRGSEVAYLVAGLKYDAGVWEEQWPRVMNNCIAACQRHGTRLVFFDNVYAYGRVDGVMTEETPFRPTSRKGAVRARIATTLLEAVGRREVEAMIVRSADFYGPGATLSLTHSTVFERLRAGKTPQWVADPERIHSFTYTPDVGRALAVLGQRAEAFGQTWHAPTSPEYLPVREFLRLACQAAQLPDRVTVAPRWMLRAMGLFVPVLRENEEMMYQFDADYRFSSRKLEDAYGLSATPYAQGIRETL